MLLVGATGAADLAQEGAIRDEHDLVVVIGAIQGIRARLLEVRAKGDRVAGRAIRLEPEDQDVARRRHRSRIDRGRRARRAVNDAGIPLVRPER